MMTSTVLGGRGGIGGLVARVLADGTDVHSVDLGALPGDGRTSVHEHVGDATSPDDALSALLRRSDIVVLAVPEAVLAGAAEACGPHMRPGALLVHTSSVQSAGAEPVDAVAARHGLESCGICPMFAPTLDPAGRAISVTAGRPGELGGRLVAALGAAGMTVLPLSPEQHDRLTAQIQVATHASVLAFGTVLAESELTLQELLTAATPPMHLMLMLCARIIDSEPEVYREIQGRHPLGTATRKELAEALARLGDAAEDAHAFEGLVASVRDKLGPARPPLADQCARVMSDLDSPRAALPAR